VFTRWQKAVEETRDLDLLPVMNLFMVLIPFLLMGAAFYHIGVIPTSLPTHTPQESDVPATPTTVTINLQIAPDQIAVTASSTGLDQDQLDTLGAAWPKRGEYDVDGVRAHLRTIKERYPESNTMIVLPHEELDYESLVHVLDATRDYPTGQLDERGEEARADLFPVVVFSRLITAEAGGEEAPAPEEAP
jgi:biopolymer transport protein ExbD